MKRYLDGLPFNDNEMAYAIFSRCLSLDDKPVSSCNDNLGPLKSRDSKLGDDDSGREYTARLVFIIDEIEPFIPREWFARFS
jgi:hypothetical protein